MPRGLVQTTHLRPRAKILRILGDELISSEIVALIELAKNAFDADATRVLIRFRPPCEVGKGSIEVVDNGTGMSRDTVENDWMEPGTMVKRRHTRSELRGRRVLGEKGVGRFAASRLSDLLEMVTRRTGGDTEIRAVFDWSKFDDERKFLDQIEISIEEGDPEEIRPDGTIRALWSSVERPSPIEQEHGTILRMKALRADWSSDQFNELRLGLARLVSPFQYEKFSKGEDEFQIRLEVPDPFEELSGVVEPPEALRNPHYTLKGDIDSQGRYEFSLKLRGKRETEELRGRFAPSNGQPPRCGPFSIELRVWDRDQASMAELAREFGSTTTDVRRDLDDAAGINIYRDGFRVLPYGEARNDWLRLDLRRVQNPTLRLSNNQIVGYVLISADKNPELRDQSNREGLIEGPALSDLRKLVLMALTELEVRRYAVRRPHGKKEERLRGLFAGFDLGPVRDFVKKQHPDDTELLTLLEQRERNLEEGVEAIQQVLSRYQRLATLGQLIDVVLHDGRAPLSKIGNEADLGLRDIERSGVKNRFGLRLGQRLSNIKLQVASLASVFRKIEPFGGRKRGRPTKVRLETVIADAISVLEGEIAEIGAQISLPKGETVVTADSAELQEVIINLLMNSLYWLRQVPKGEREVAVRVRRRGPSEVDIIFSDSGPGVDPEFRDRIFEPYFSTKSDGVGLGLTIAGDIVKEYYDGELELIEGGPLHGATFRIKLRRRV